MRTLAHWRGAPHSGASPFSPEGTLKASLRPPESSRPLRGQHHCFGSFLIFEESESGALFKSPPTCLAACPLPPARYAQLSAGTSAGCRGPRLRRWHTGSVTHLLLVPVSAGESLEAECEWQAEAQVSSAAAGS